MPVPLSKSAAGIAFTHTQGRMETLACELTVEVKQTLLQLAATLAPCVLGATLQGHGTHTDAQTQRRRALLRGPTLARSAASYLACGEYAKFLELLGSWESSDLGFLLACPLLLAQSRPGWVAVPRARARRSATGPS